jgi:ERF superfamily
MPDPELTETLDPYIYFTGTSWMASDPCGEVIPAFVEALWEVEDLVKRNKVEAGPMRYSYADLSDVFDEIKPKLRKNGLALSQSATVEMGVTTTLFHKSGQWIRFAPLLIRPSGGTPQNMGSAITYARRYSVMAVMGLATEDDDGRSASVVAAPSAVDDPMVGRINTLLHTLGSLTDDQKADVRKMADDEGRKLSGAALHADPEWLSQVEQFVAMLQTDE